MRLFCLILPVVLLLLSQHSHAASRPLLDIVDIQGVRDNQLVGYGLVVGLPGSGDKAQIKFAAQSLNNMLKQFGVQLDEASLPKSKNVAAVAVHAELPAFSKPGQTIDITVSSMGSAKGLRGGTLLQTFLKGLDGQVYAVAQGSIQTGSVSASGASGSTITRGVPTAGRIASGATVERETGFHLANMNEVRLTLRNPDFTTAARIAGAINAFVGVEAALALDPATGRWETRAPAPMARNSAAVAVLNDALWVAGGALRH